MKASIKNAQCYSYESNTGSLITNIDLNLYENNGLNVEGKNESSIIRFYNYSVFNNAIINNVENSVIFAELSYLKTELTNEELAPIVCCLLTGSNVEIEQIVITKDTKGNELKDRSFVDTQINNVELTKKGIKAFYIALFNLKGEANNIESIKNKIDFALEEWNSKGSGNTTITITYYSSKQTNIWYYW